METWIRTSHKKYYSLINLSKLRAEIQAELIDPLFMKAGVNIKDEDDIPKHRNDNLVCCDEYFLRELKRIKKKGSRDELFLILEEFRSCYKKIVSATNKKSHAGLPFSWMFDCPRSNVPLLKLDELILQKEKIKAEFEKSYDNFLDNPILYNPFDYGREKKKAVKRQEELWRALSEVSEKIDQIKLEKFAREFEVDRNINLAVQQIQRHLMSIKAARGKRGRRLDPFNVLIYHLINKCTRWKLDENRKYVYRKGFYKLEKCENGQNRLVKSDRGGRQYRLEKNWKLILFLVLDIHFHIKKLQKIEEFISQHKNKPADEALRNLKQKLLDIYKNYPPLDGWPFPYKTDETGFRKLIIKDDGSLKIVRL